MQMLHKKIKFLYAIAAAAILLSGIAACNKAFLDQSTTGLLTEAELKSKKGAEQLLIGAYAAIKGIGWEGGTQNWVYGSIVGLEANKGSDAGDQADINPIQQYSALPGNNFFNVKWRAVYEGVARANAAIRIASDLTEADITADEKNQLLAEARFLRAFYHFEAKKMWKNIPFVDETIKYGESTLADVGNQTDAWPRIMEDFQFARTTLTPTKAQIGRVNKWAADAFYAKALLFQQDYTGALPILTDVINNGVTSGNIPYDLAPSFHDLFNPEKETDNTTRAESVFAYEASINDGSGGFNANYEQILNFPYNNGPGTCCGFFQPSFSFVNAFRTNAGLPLLDYSYNSPANEVKNDMGLEVTQAFTPDAGKLDPRLDWTVGRRGIPFLDWGEHPGKSWIRDQGNGGPYTPKKMSYYKAQQGEFTDKTSWTSGLTSTNFKLMRFADVLLMAAEAEVEVGTLANALGYVNQVRARASNPATWVKNGANNAADYEINPYPAFPDQDYARRAVRMERLLELGMEGHRFFDLVRWGIAEQEINTLLPYERGKLSAAYGTGTFQAKHNYFPIPQRQIDLQQENGTSTLVQNEGY
jgi:starch-binding outer membrane protein, SusD/RagB family